MGICAGLDRSALFIHDKRCRDQYLGYYEEKAHPLIGPFWDNAGKYYFDVDLGQSFWCDRRCDGNGDHHVCRAGHHSKYLL